MGVTMNKKGSFDDIIILIIVALVLATTTIVCYMMLSKVNNAFQESPDIPPVAKTILSDNTNRYVALFDGVFLVVFIMLGIGSLLLASQINTNPVFMPISILLFIVMIILSAIIGNVYYDISHSIDYSGTFTIIPFVMNHIVQIMLGLGFLLAVVMYGRSQ